MVDSAVDYDTRRVMRVVKTRQACGTNSREPCRRIRFPLAAPLRDANRREAVRARRAQRRARGGFGRAGFLSARGAPRPTR